VPSANTLVRWVNENAFAFLAQRLVSPSPSANEVGLREELFHGSIARPVRASVNASPAMSPPPAHDSRSGWFATPFLWGSFLPDSLPVYPGAFALSLKGPQGLGLKFAIPHRNPLR